MKSSIRNSGIDIVGNVPWGTHFCQFYQTKEDLADILVPYFRAGLENNEFCLWITSYPLEVEEAKKALRRTIPDIDAYLEKGQIEIISYTCLHVNGSIYDSEKITNGWIEKLNHALKSGYEGLRLSVNISWLEKEVWGYFVAHMGKMDDIIEKCRIISLGSYFVDKCSATEIIEVVSNHQFSLTKKEGKWERIVNFGRKKAEEAAIQATKNWEYTFDAVPDLIAIIDTKYRIVRANRAMAAKLKVTPKECIGLTCYHAIHGTSEPPSFCPHQQLLNDGLEYTAEIFEDCLGGYFIVSASPLHDSEGKLIGSIYVAREINERKMAEEALRLSNTYNRSLIEASLDPLVTIGRDGKITDVNGATEQVTGYSRSELIGTDFSDYFTEPEKAREGYQQVFTDGEVRDYPLEIQHKDGHINPVLYNASVYRDENGEIIGVFAAARDITERKKAEETLKKVHDNLEKLVEKRTKQLEKAYNSLKEIEKGLAEAQKMAHIGNWEWDIATDKAYWSKEMYHIFGRKPTELAPSYNEYLNYIHPDDRNYFDNAAKRAMNGKPYSIDHRIVLANGEVRTVHVQSEIIFDKRNTPIRVKGIVQDITERKRAEENVQTLASIVESSQDAIITISLDGIISSWNKGAAQIYGYSAEEILGKNASILAPDNLKGEIKKLIDRIKQEIKIKNYETTKLKKDGKLINVSLTLSPIFDASGKMTAISVIARDITERIKTEKSLAKAEDARKKEIHHRIKNNLQVISSLLDLQADKFNDAKVIEAFRESQNRVISMALIHEELYKEEGTDTLNFSEYLKTLVENLFQTYRLSSKNIHLNMDLEENTFFDMDTAVPLGIIVNELLSNSLKHAFPDRDKGEIRIKLHSDENKECKTDGCKSTIFTLTVSDNGAGIPEYLDIEDLDSLGLQLVTSLVDQLEGELKLKRDNGTEFTIRFTVTEKNNPTSAPAALQQSIE